MAAMIVKSNVPFLLVEEEGFKISTEHLNPGFHNISRRTLGRDIKIPFNKLF